MFKGAGRLLASFLGKHLASPPQPIEVSGSPPAEVFPIPPQYNYCELFQPRMIDEVHVTLQIRRKPWRMAFYILKTPDLELVQQWVQAEGFVPAWDSFHFQFERFSDPDGNYFFYSRKGS